VQSYVRSRTPFSSSNLLTGKFSPVGLPRVVPPGGGTVAGYLLPADTFVNVHPLTLSLSPSNFHDPHGFHPERWLASATEDKNSPFFNDNHRAVQAFSVGPRSCVGKPLALAELRIILGKIVWNFDLEDVDTEAGKLRWADQRVFTVVERKPFEIRLRRRSGK
jgi:cytochrome P450